MGNSTADERRQHEGEFVAEGTARRTGASNRWALAKVHHAETAQRAVCSVTAPMRKVHEKADERVHGTWVGRSFELN